MKTNLLSLLKHKLLASVNLRNLFKNRAGPQAQVRLEDADESKSTDEQMNDMQNVHVPNCKHPQPSQDSLGQTRFIYYQLGFMCKQEPWDICEQKQTEIKGTIQYISPKQTQPTIYQVEQLLVNKLVEESLFTQHNCKLIIRRIHKSDLSHIENEEKCSFKVKGYLILSKINIDPSYVYMPAQFAGYIVRNLSIANQHGMITWLQPVNVAGIDFSSETVSIQRAQFRCRHPQLRKSMMVEFYRLPANLQKLMEKNSARITQRLRQCVECYGQKLKCSSDGDNKPMYNREPKFKLISLCHSNQHWVIYIDKWQ